MASARESHLAYFFVSSKAHNIAENQSSLLSMALLLSLAFKVQAKNSSCEEALAFIVTRNKK
eukprot:c46035_g1_i1 orf=90-275(+)